MPNDTQSWIIAALVFLSGVLTLATQMLALSPDVTKWVLFAAAVVDLALAVFFGRTALTQRRARLAAKAAK